MSNNNQGLFPEFSEPCMGIGHGNFVVIHRIVTLVETGPLPVKRLRDQANEKGVLIDATAGRKMRSLIILDSGQMILSALSAQTLRERMLLQFKPPKSGIPEWQEREFVS